MVSVLSCFGCASRASVQTNEADVDLQQQHQQQTYQHSYDPIKPAADKGQQQGGNRQAMLYVRMASMSSSGGADSAGGASDHSEPATAAAAEEEVWFEAEEQADWLAGAAPELDSISEAPPGSQSSEARPCLTAEQLAALAVLPAQLQKLLTKYLQGAVGCKPLVALMRYMQDSSTSLSVLQDMLQPLLDAEQHLPPQMPVPSPQMTPAERSAFLRSQLKQAHPASSSSEQQQQQSSQPRIAHLLKTLGLAVRTLHIMDQEQGFKQVASGPLSLWYRHDTVAKSQILRARVVLDESVATIAAIAREFDLVTSWNPGMSDLRELATYSATEVLIYLLPWMPWPLPLPELVNFGFAVDLLDLQPRCVLLHTSSAEAPPGVEVPQHSRTLPVHMNVGGFRMVPLPPSADKPTTPRTEVTVLVSIDAARFVVPDSVISCVLKVFAPLVHKSVLKVFARMFHTAAATAASGPAVRAGPAAADGPRCSSPTTCTTSLLVERLGLRPEYAVLDAHAARVLEAEAEAAAAGPAGLLELDIPRTTGAGVAG